VALWLIDHQMNMLISQEFGEYFVRLPLRKSAKIVHGNALRTDWDSMIELLPWESKTDREQYDYILGNPPFSGKSLQDAGQKSDMELIFNGVKGAGVLDYVTAWYIKAAKYLEKHNTPESPGAPLSRARTNDTCVAFVSTNSISQGEQVGILWNELFNRYKIKIHFAHRTFKWGNEAKANAAVHVVIIGFSNFDISEKLIYEYEDIKGEPHELKVKNINPYLVEGKDNIILARNKVLSIGIPEMSWGNKPVDGGHLIMDDKEKDEFILKEPLARNLIKPLICAKEFLNAQKRWCLWLVDVNPNDLRNLPHVIERVKLVKEVRKASVDEGARKLASRPTQFRDIKTYNNYILIPAHSSENRKYIPMGFFGINDIPHNSCQLIPEGTLFHFGILTSEMHMSWVKYICGRIKSDFRYSKDIVYNNYPWPENPTDKQKETIEQAAKKYWMHVRHSPAAALPIFTIL